MIKNFLKIAWRNLVKDKSYSLINIAGLAIGLACFLLIALYVVDELSYDRFNEKADRIYRIHSDIRFGGADLHMPVTSDMMGQLLQKDYPQIEASTRMYTFNGHELIKKGSDFIDEFRLANVDSNFFNVFTIQAVAGNLHTALVEPHTVVISESIAKKYFGTTDALGKILDIRRDSGTIPIKVTAVVKDMPANSHFRFDLFFTMKDVDYNWGQITSHNFYTYLLLKPGADYKALEKNFPVYLDRYVLPYVKQFIKINSLDEFKKAGNMLEYSLMPLKKIHLYSNRSFELSPNGNIQYVYIFSAVALFILLIACVNFMNLTTARSANRAKEVGIRKVLGTGRRELVTQFLFESTLMVFIAIMLAIGIDYFVLGLFNEVSGKDMHLSSLFTTVILPVIVLLPFVVGVMAGSYPAFFLSRFRPVEVLKGKLKLGAKSGSLRSVLVVFQFATSIILIIGTIVVYRQLQLIQNQNVGFKKEQVLVIDGSGALGKNVDAFKQEVLQMPGVVSGSVSGYLPVENSSRNDNSFSKSPVIDAKNGFDMQIWRVDYDYLSTLGMQLKSGRNFSRDFGSDSTAVIINETTAQILGYPDPIGKKIYTIGNPGQEISYTVIGVVKNFNYESLRKTVGPLALRLGNSPWTISFRINTSNIKNLVSQVEAKWKALAPGMPFAYSFLDDSFDDMYRAEMRVGKIAMVFAVIAIFIACLGLFGLATFIAEQRTKEIGVRKVLGASVESIVRMLSVDFAKLVTISALIAFPVAWYVMHHWLQDFAYRTSLSWWIFVGAGLVGLFIALFTISFQAIRAALSNPVKSLRTE